MFNIDIEKKKFLRDEALKIRQAYVKKYQEKFYWKLILEQSLIEFYRQNKYEISNDEKTYFSLHILIPDDIEFLNVCKKYKYNTLSDGTKTLYSRYDFEKISKLYDLTPNIIKSRYSVMLDNFKNNIVEYNNSNANTKGLK